MGEKKAAKKRKKQAIELLEQSCARSSLAKAEFYAEGGIREQLFEQITIIWTKFENLSKSLKPC